MDAISASVSGSSSGFEPKSKFSASESSMRLSTSSGSLSMAARLSSASIFVSATTGCTSAPISMLLGSRPVAAH